MNKTEEWRDVVGYEGLYQVSDMGAIRSLDRVVSCQRHGSVKRKGKTLKPYLSGEKKGQYLSVRLSSFGVSKNHRVHKLVASAFMGNSNGATVDHIDNDKMNNKLVNLQYISSRDNSIKAFNLKVKKFPTGVSESGSKYRASIYFNGVKIGLKSCDTIREAAEVYQFAKSYIEHKQAKHNDLIERELRNVFN